MENIHSLMWGCKISLRFENFLCCDIVSSCEAATSKKPTRKTSVKGYMHLCVESCHQRISFCNSVFPSFLFLYFSTALCLETANSYLIHEAAKEADEAPGSPCNSSTDHLNGNDHHDHY